MDYYYGKGSEVSQILNNMDIFDTLDYTSTYAIVLLMNILLANSSSVGKISGLRSTLAKMYWPKLLGLFYSQPWQTGFSRVNYSSTDAWKTRIELLKWQVQCIFVPTAIVLDSIAGVILPLWNQRNSLYPSEVINPQVFLSKQNQASNSARRALKLAKVFSCDFFFFVAFGLSAPMRNVVTLERFNLQSIQCFSMIQGSLAFVWSLGHLWLIYQSLGQNPKKKNLNCAFKLLKQVLNSILLLCVLLCSIDYRTQFMPVDWVNTLTLGLIMLFYFVWILAL